MQLLYPDDNLCFRSSIRLKLLHVFIFSADAVVWAYIDSFVIGHIIHSLRGHFIADRQANLKSPNLQMKIPPSNWANREDLNGIIRCGVILCKKPVMLCWCKSPCDWLVDCLQWLQEPAGLAAAPWLGTGSFSLGKGDTPVCPFLLDLQEDVRTESAPFELSGSPPVVVVVGLAGSPLLQGLQTCTNKGGIKKIKKQKNKSKQTNGIRVMGVGGLVPSDKHNDALCVSVCSCVWGIISD